MTCLIFKNGHFSLFYAALCNIRHSNKTFSEHPFLCLICLISQKRGLTETPMFAILEKSSKATNGLAWSGSRLR